MEHPVSIEALSTQAAKVCGPSALPALKAMAAGGFTPFSPSDLVTVLYFLSFDADSSIAQKAVSTIAGLPDTVLEGAISQVLNEVILDGLARLLIERTGAIKKMLLSPRLAFETTVWITKKSSDDAVLEMVAENEQRLLESPEIIEALYKNKAARMSTVDRCIELAIRNGLELSGISCFAEVKAAIKGELIPEATLEPTPDDLMFIANLERGALENIDEEKLAETLDNIDNAKDPVEGTEKVKTLQQSLSQLTISAKIRVATLGSSTQRAILIRDSNKLVCMAVIKSPGVRESEIMLYSRFRSLPEEAIRYMAGNRGWTKHYGVKLNLVQNPRCPLEIALKFLNFIRINDVKAIERDKNISQAVANAARQLKLKRTK